MQAAGDGEFINLIDSADCSLEPHNLEAHSVRNNILTVDAYDGSSDIHSDDNNKIGDKNNGANNKNDSAISGSNRIQSINSPAFIKDNIINGVDDIAISDILNSMEEAVVITNKENKVIFCNSYFMINFNINLNGCLNKNIKEIQYFKYLFSDDLTVPTEIKDLASGYKVTNIYEIDEQNHYFENDRIPIYDSSGEIKGIVYLFRDITKEIRFEQKLNILAKTDSLSGLYNSRYFYDELEKEMARCARYDYDLALMFIDIDNFKIFNDTYGHKIGDEIIRFTAYALNNSIRKKIDTVCRYGGDEFVAILPNTNAMRSTIVANRIMNFFNNGLNEKLQTVLKEDVCADNNTVADNIGADKKINLSIGISEYKNGKKSEELINEADSAMYKAKKQSGCKVCIFNNNL